MIAAERVIPGLPVVVCRRFELSREGQENILDVTGKRLRQPRRATAHNIRHRPSSPRSDGDAVYPASAEASSRARTPTHQVWRGDHTRKSHRSLVVHCDFRSSKPPAAEPVTRLSDA